MGDKDETKDEKWIKWRDLQGSEVRVRPNMIVGTLRASAIARGPQGQTVPSMIFCMGITSPVSEQTVDDVLMAVGQESWIKN